MVLVDADIPRLDALFQKDSRQECSGCGQKDITVDRDMFDGTCANCTNKCLYDETFQKKAQKRNEELKSVSRPWPTDY